MKKVLFIVTIITLLGANVFAADGGKKKDNTTEVSYFVANQFAADFKEAKDITWTVSKNCNRADFTVNNEKMSAFYGFDGEFIGLTHDLDAKAIPAKAMGKINKKYKGYEVGKVIVLQTNASLNDNIDPVAYFVDLKSKSEEILVRITPAADIEFFQQIQ